MEQPNLREVAKTPEQMSAEYEQNAKLGRGILNNANFRMKNSLAPFINPKKFLPEDAAATGKLKEGEEVDSKKAEDAKWASASVSFEAAIQVLETKFSATQAREDPTSLAALKKSLEEGFRVWEAAGKKGEVAKLREIAEQTIGKRKAGFKTEKMDDGAFAKFAGENFRQAHLRITQAEENIRRYVRR